MSCTAVHRNAGMYPALDPTGPELFPAPQKIFHENFCIDELPDFSCIDASPENSGCDRSNAKKCSAAQKENRKFFCIDELPDLCSEDQFHDDPDNTPDYFCNDFYPVPDEPGNAPDFFCNDFDLVPENPEPVRIVRRKFFGIPERLSDRLGKKLIAFDRKISGFPQRRWA
jgi:hypothetical protein